MGALYFLLLGRKTITEGKSRECQGVRSLGHMICRFEEARKRQREKGGVRGGLGLEYRSWNRKSCGGNDLEKGKKKIRGEGSLGQRNSGRTLVRKNNVINFW